MQPPDLWSLLKGVGIGVAVAAPVGPMSLLCMRRTLTKGWPFGCATGAGIATGDALYAAVAALGLAGVSRFMLAHERPLHVAAGLFLLYLGLRTCWGASGVQRDPRSAASLPAVYGSALLLTLTNPPTIVSFAAIFAAVAPQAGFTVSTAVLTVAGVFAGSALWWLVLTAGIAAFRQVLGVGTRRAIDQVSGAVLAAFGVAEIKRAA